MNSGIHWSPSGLGDGNQVSTCPLASLISALLTTLGLVALTSLNVFHFSLQEQGPSLRSAALGDTALDPLLQH